MNISDKLQNCNSRVQSYITATAVSESDITDLVRTAPAQIHPCIPPLIPKGQHQTSFFWNVACAHTNTECICLIATTSIVFELHRMRTTICCWKARRVSLMVTWMIVSITGNNAARCKFLVYKIVLLLENRWAQTAFVGSIISRPPFDYAISNMTRCSWKHARQSVSGTRIYCQNKKKNSHTVSSKLLRRCNFLSLQLGPVTHCVCLWQRRTGRSS